MMCLDQNKTRQFPSNVPIHASHSLAKNSQGDRSVVFLKSPGMTKNLVVNYRAIIVSETSNLDGLQKSENSKTIWTKKLLLKKAETDFKVAIARM